MSETKSVEFDEGIEARCAGSDTGECPYTHPSDDMKRIDWMLGYYKACKEALLQQNRVD